MQTNELYVGNLDRNVKPEELKEIFQRYGNIKRCVVKVGDTTHTASYGFVMFESAAEAESAKEQTNGLNLHGRRMIIQFSKTKPGKGRRLDHFIGLELAENQNNKEHDRSRSRDRHRRRRRSPSYSRRISRSEKDRDDRHRKRSRSRSSSSHKLSSKRSRLSKNDDKYRSSHSSRNGNSKRH